MFIALTINTCYADSNIEPYANYPSPNTIAVHLFVTNNGLNQYSSKNIEIALSSIQIPPISLNFTVLGFNILISDSKFLQLALNNISFKTLNDAGRVAVDDINVEIFFALQILQKTFPYLSDSGSLTITIRKLAFSSNLKIDFPDLNCKQKFAILRDHSVIEVDNFKFSFKCGLEIILNSISAILEGVLKVQLNGALGQQMVGVVLDGLLGILTNMNQYATVEYGNVIWSDQRVVNGVKLVENFFLTGYTGQRLRNATGEAFHGWLNDTIGETVSFITSNDVQYQIEKIVFNSGFQLYLEDERCTGEGVCIEDIRLERFHNTGAKVLVNISFGGKTETLIFLEPVVPKPVYMGVMPGQEDQKFSITFGIRLTNLIGESQLLDKSLIENLSVYFNNTFRLYDYVIDNIIGINQDTFIVIYLNENWIHVGANF